MQILHIITGLGKGGAETLLCNLCQFDSDYKHTIISLSDLEGSESIINKPNVSLYSLNFLEGKIKLFGLFKLFKLIKKIKPDVVQTWMIHADLVGGIVARFAGIKNVFWGVHHTILIPGKVKASTIFILKINAFLSNIIPKKIIYCAEKSRESQESIGFNKSKGIVIQNGYDIKNFFHSYSLRSDFRNELNIPKNSFVLGHVGSNDPLKDQNTLIEALALIDHKQFNFIAILVGKNLDNDNNDLVSMIKEKGLSERIHLKGIRSDISAIMNGIDLFMLSSVSEAFPSVLNESMACGTPCVTTDVGDAAIIVGNTGWIVRPKDPIALANAITHAMKENQSNNEIWLKRKDNCRKRIVENFSLEKMVKKYKQVWLGE